ncbi:MAG: hypothetical protein QXE05_00050 [Nitrososphaeria archaeon]
MNNIILMHAGLAGFDKVDMVDMVRIRGGALQKILKQYLIEECIGCGGRSGRGGTCF